MGGWWLAIAAAGFWAGILAAGVGERGLGTGGALLLLVFGCLVLVAPLILRPSRRWLPLLAAWLVAGFCAVGAGWSSLRQARIRDSPLVHLAGRPVRVVGSLSSDPEPYPLGWTASFDAGLVAWPVAGELTGIRLHDPVWLEGRGPPPKLRSGDRVDVRGLVELLHGEFGRYLSHRGYAATLQADDVEFVGPPRNPVLVMARALRSGLRRSLGRIFPDREAGLLMGLALGDTSRLDPAIEEDFRATGLSHLTAVSGENLIMFLAPILAVVVLIRLARTGRLLVGGAAISFFVLLTGAEPSVLRAAAMVGIALIGIFLGRPRSPRP